MNLFALVLIAVAVAAVIAYLAHRLTLVVKDDGYHSSTAQRTPPRSHHAEPFDPHSRFA